MRRKQKLLIIVGPTSSGKSALAVALARKFGGEVISADSRQVYRGLDIGTGKITKREMKGVPHYLLDEMTSHRVGNVELLSFLASLSFPFRYQVRDTPAANRRKLLHPRIFAQARQPRRSCPMR